jgi:hypothetical protein
MIFNLFSYPSNFGAIKIYKCDYYGNKISNPRVCFVDQFSAAIEQQNVDDITRFGGLNQNNTFRINNRQIKISATFLFELDPSGILSAGTDILFNLCAQAFQGTNASYKLSTSSLTSTSATYNELFIPQYLNLQNSNIPYYNFYLVSESTSTLLNVNGINTSAGLINYNQINIPSGKTWLELFKYGGTYRYPLYLEPMFRMDTSEGSFYNCLIDKINFSMNEDYAKLSVDILCIDFDRSTRFDFINSNQVLNSNLSTRILHRSRIRIDDFTANSYNFNVSTSTLEIYNYMNGLITQSFKNTPVKELSLSINNNLEPIYGNDYYSTRRTYVKGFVSKNKKIEGNMSTYALRSDQPTFDKFPFITNDSTKNLSIIFGSQRFNIPYTVWTPGKIEVNQNNLVTLSFNFQALTNQRYGQPDFINDTLTNF